MTDFIAQIAKLLKTGKTVIFYTVGSDTLLSIKELNFRFDLLPSAICDRDPKKQGRAWKGLESVQVISPDEAIGHFPEAYWFVPSLNYRYQIIGYLTQERGIAPKRIINYEPVRKFRSCVHLNQSIQYERNGNLTFSCAKECPRTPINKEEGAAAFRILRDTMLKALEAGHIPNSSHCANCDLIKEDYYPVEPKGLYINYFCNNVCNYSCCYCTVRHSEKIENDIGKLTLCDVMDALRRENMLSADYDLDFATAGEPTLYPGRKEVYKMFDGDKMGFITNGFLFDPDLLSLMNRKKVYVITSIDAGTKETYQRIKGVDGFEQVRQNMKRYAQSSIGIVILKYILMPGVNDFPSEIDGFVDFCIETGATFVIASLDVYSVSMVTEQTVAMAKRLMNSLSKENILCIPLTANHSEEYANIVRTMTAIEE